MINSAARGTGYFDTPTDPDAVFRSEMMVIRFGKRYCEPLILAVTSAFAGNALTSLTLADFGVAGAKIGPVELPVDEQGHLLVNFRGPAHTFPYYPVSDVIPTEFRKTRWPARSFWWGRQRWALATAGPLRWAPISPGLKSTPTRSTTS